MQVSVRMRRDGVGINHGTIFTTFNMDFSFVILLGMV